MALNPTTDGAFLRSKLLIFWALLTLIGLLLAISFLIGRTAAGEFPGILNAVNSQMLRFQIWAALAIFVVWSDAMLRRISTRWALLLPMHLSVGMVWSVVATGAMVLLFWLFDGLLNSAYQPLSDVMIAAGIPSLVMGIVGYKIILTTNYALDFHRKFNDERNRAEKLESQLARAQLSALKMQLQPHFLFNALNSLSDLALEDSRKAVHMIARLGDFLRLTIETNGTQLVSLESELEFLKNYLEIEQVRFRDRLKPEFRIEPEALSARVPNLILQPGVENAIKHGLSKSLDAGRISVRGRRESDRLVMEIENDGPLNGSTASGNGLGLANTRERLEQIYGGDFEMEFGLLPGGGGRLRISIPFDELTEDD